MAQPPTPNPTLNARIGSSTTEVNLRDWLNTRLAPFLKRAITESLDSEAQYPLQWLGERLIQQSILFEGNPDSTNIKERFLYNHENVAKPTQAGGREQAQAATSAQSSLPVVESASEQAQSGASPMTDAEHSVTRESDQGHSTEVNPTTDLPAPNTVSEQVPGVNGTMQVEQVEQSESTRQTEESIPAEDAEMTNAP